MARISVYREADDGLSRRCWTFWTSAGSSGEAVLLVLDSYGIERRNQPKGRFSTARPDERWMSSDERRYSSGFDRPTDIPGDVRAEALRAVKFEFHIGWTNPESKMKAA